MLNRFFKPNDNTFYYLLIFLVGFLLYLNSFSNPFIWDDRVLIADNPYIRDIKSLIRAFATDISFGRETTSSYRPLVNVSFILDYCLWGLKPFGYHLTNTILHILNSCCVFFLLSVGLGQNILFSSLVSLLFLVHPLQTNVVTYISGRSDALSGLFFLLAMVFYLRFIQKNKVYLFSSALFFYYLAILSKEIALVFPFIIMLYEFTFLSLEQKTSLRPKRIWRYGWLFSIFFTYLMIRYTVLKSLVGLSSSFYPPFFKRLLPMPLVFCRYLRLLLLPYGLSLSHQVHLPKSLWESQTIVAIFIWVLIIILSLRSIRYSKLVFFGWVWFLIYLFAISNIIPLNAYMHEAWLYLPSIGFFIALVGMGFRWGKWPWVLIFSLAMISGYAYLTLKRNLDYQNPIKFYDQTLIYSPRNYKVYHNLGILYLEKGEDLLALNSFKHAIRFKPDFAPAYLGLGFICQKREEKTLAEKMYQEALRLNPNLKEAQELLLNLKEKR